MDKEKLGKLSPRDLDILGEYIEYLDLFKQRAINKFIEGRIQHHDENPMELDFEKEIENEIFDITAYNFLKKYKDEFRRNTDRN
jgi:hypothetical protein